MINGTKIVCLCGSTRFTSEMLNITWNFALQSIIAIGWYVLPSNHLEDGREIDHHLAEKLGVAELLDNLHLKKIDLADEIFVVNVGGYVGEGTKREILYAMDKDKSVKYLEPEWDYPFTKKWKSSIGK